MVFEKKIVINNCVRKIWGRMNMKLGMLTIDEYPNVKVMILYSSMQYNVKVSIFLIFTIELIMI